MSPLTSVMATCICLIGTFAVSSLRYPRALLSVPAMSPSRPGSLSGGLGRRGRYSVARLREQHGDAKLTDLLLTLANCQKARSASIHDRCKAVHGQRLP